MTESAITVAVRSRPLLTDEEAPAQPLSFDEGNVVMQNKTFCFDFAFPPYVSNQAIYKAVVANKIHHIFDGYNVTILAYGPTGSGKTHTMGTDYSPKSNINSDIGIIPQGLHEIFRVLESEKEVKTFSVKVSFFELYQEVFYDLCHSNVVQGDKSDPKVVEEKDGNFKVSNMTEKSVNSVEEAFSILIKGSNIRHTSATAKNAKSSRSHAIFTVYIEQIDKSTFDAKRAKFQLVDLAGSERMSTSKTDGAQLKEGIKINLSLLTLSKVITALSDNNSHVPYRESKLTRLLQDSLGGNSHTVMITCVNPSSTSMEETLSTLRYASNARRIRNRPVVNLDPPAVQILKLKKQLESLQAQIYKTQPLRDLNSTTTPNSDGKALQLLQNAYLKINTLNQQLVELEEKDGFIKGRLTSFYETIKVIVAEITPAAAADNKLKIHLDKLEEIQSECFQLVIQQGNMITIMEDSENSSQTSLTTDDYESCESILPMDLDPEPLVRTSDEAFFTPTKSEEDLQEELNEVAKKHKSSSKNLENVDMQINFAENVQRYFEYMCGNHGTAVVEKKADSLATEIQLLVKEKTDLEERMQSCEKENKCLQENTDKVLKYEQEIKKLQRELCAVKKNLQIKDETKAKVQRLKTEIQELKKSRVNILKQVKDSSSANRAEHLKKDKNIIKLESMTRKKEVEITKLKDKFEKQVKVLEAKVNQATTSKTGFLTLRKNKPHQTGVKPMQSQGSLKEWIKEELKITVGNNLVKANLESLEKDAELLKEQIKKIEELSPSAEKPTEADELKAVLQVQLVQIADMRKHAKDFDPKAKSGIILDGVTDLSETKSTIEYLYNKCVSVEVETSKMLQTSEENMKEQRAINESSDEKVKLLSDEVKFLKDEIDQLKVEHAQQIARTTFEHEAEMLKYMTKYQTVTPSSTPIAADPNLIKTVEQKEHEIKEADTLYKQKCAEVAQLQLELFKVKKKRSSTWLSGLTTSPDKSKSPKKSFSHSMIAEYLSEEGESFCDDEKDPDWHATPQYKQAKRRKIESKAENILKIADYESSESQCSMETSETDSAFIVKPIIFCKCEGDCKTMRCRCKKRQTACSDACSCSNKCSNASELST